MKYFILFFMMLLNVWLTNAHANSFSMTSNSFSNQGKMPTLYTCDGKDHSPELAWSNPPTGTQSFVLIVSDPDAPAGTWYHWIIYNLPATTKELAENVDTLPSGAMLGKNSWERAVYNGPCPPPGATHRYIFTLYAVDGVMNLAEGADGLTVLRAIKGHELGEVGLEVSYHR